jgi:hypothetical protein
MAYGADGAGKRARKILKAGFDVAGDGGFDGLMDLGINFHVFCAGMTRRRRAS